jgi:transcriptional regulator GlxA family with amidase domain
MRHEASTHAGIAQCCPNAAAIGQVVEFIEQNFADRLQLRDLAKIADLSVFRFVTVFRHHTGLPPHRYLCHVRVRRAKSLLRQGVPLAIAASEAGFFDQSHLSRHFKNICGITPGQYVSRMRRQATGTDTYIVAKQSKMPQAVAL